jgi:hypothetical protein
MHGTAFRPYLCRSVVQLLGGWSISVSVSAVSGPLAVVEQICFTTCLCHLLISGAGEAQSVSDYRLYDRATIVRSPTETKYFPIALCPDQVCGPLSPLPNGYRGPFPWGKARPWRDTDHLPQLVLISRTRSYCSSPPRRMHGLGDSFTLFIDIQTPIYRVGHSVFRWLLKFWFRIYFHLCWKTILIH